MKKSYGCFFCSNKFTVFEDLMHHVKLQHVGISSQLLDESTKSRETKKQLGDYIDQTTSGMGFECCHCYQMFSSLDKLSEHGRNVHQVEFNPTFFEKLEELKKLDKSHPPICEKCHREFLGLVITRMDNAVKNVCFNCYENYYGKNALLRLTIGTPDEMLKKLKKPVS